MIIITHPDTYRCEVCNFEHTRKEIAQYCENYVLPPCNFEIGDIVLAESRYDGYFELTIVDILLWHSHSFNYNNRDSELVIPNPGCRIPVKNGFITEPTKLVDYLRLKEKPAHTWGIITDDYVEVCKDGTCTNKWGDDALYPVKDLIWCDDFEKLKDITDDVFVKYHDKCDPTDISIQCGGYDWYNEYWATESKFIGFCIIPKKREV